MLENATAVAEEPQELYDTLNSTEQEVFDLIGSLGFRTEKDDRGDWVALSLHNDTIIGPELKLSKLCMGVQAYVEESSVEYVPEILSEDHAENSTSDEGEKAEQAGKVTYCGTPGPKGDGEFCRRELGHDGACSVSGEARAKAVRKVSKKPPTGLTLADVAVWSAIKGLGFAAVRDEEDGLWAAHEIDGDEVIGDTNHLEDLLEMVKEHLTDDTEIVLDIEPRTKAPFLAGMEPKLNRQLANAIIAQDEAKIARVEATAKETAANKSMNIAGALHEELYEIDPDKPTTKIYQVGKIISRITITEDRKFTTEHVKGDEE